MISTQASKPYRNQSWCNPALPMEQRIDDMIARMTLAEKIASLGSSNNAIPSLGLPSYSWRSEAEHGIEYARFDQLTPYATDFAFPTTLAMSFNKTLFRAIGAQVGAEVRDGLLVAGQKFASRCRDASTIVNNHYGITVGCGAVSRHVH